MNERKRGRSVPLSDDEQAQLSEIEALILAEDPQFAAHLDLYRAAYRRQALGWLCWWLLVGVGAGAPPVRKQRRPRLDLARHNARRRRVRTDLVGRGDRVRLSHPSQLTLKTTSSEERQWRSELEYQRMARPGGKGQQPSRRRRREEGRDRNCSRRTIASGADAQPGVRAASSVR